MQYPSHIQSKLPKVGTTIFTKMSALAQEYGAINLSQGFPDFEVSGELIELVNQKMRDGLNQYAPMGGVPELREAISHKVEKLYQAKYNPDTEITVTAGATQAIFTAISSMIKEGDEVILFTPAYDCYAPTIELNGGKPVYVQLAYPNYSVDWNEVKKLVSRKTRMIIINSPHNPTGTVLSEADLLELEKITSGTDILILSDEVYEHILFDGKKHQSVCKFPELASRSFIVASFGKTFHVTGWKMGYCLAPENLMAEFRKCHQFVVFTSNTPVQHALAEFIEREDSYTGLGLFYQEKRDYFLDLIKDSRFSFKPSSGTYFQLLDYQGISNDIDTEFADRLTRENLIASIPVSVFYHNPQYNKMLRFCFAKNKETLEQAAEILCKI